MRDERIRETLKQTRQAAEQTDQTLNNVMQKLDDDALDQVTGAGNPFDGIPRPDLQPIDQDVRENG